MKFLVATGVVSAIAAQNTTEFGGARKFNRLNEMLAGLINSAHSPNEISKMIQNYGCYCFPTLANLGGKGPIQDEYDGLCRELSQCYQCVEIDFDGFHAQNNYKFEKVNKMKFKCTSMNQNDREMNKNNQK